MQLKVSGILILRKLITYAFLILSVLGIFFTDNKKNSNMIYSLKYQEINASEMFVFSFADICGYN